ncbi:RNA polymerase sigma factor [Kerstersia similis]|uniref:RNA polymerase sigma factor n=1 Tax=Kerstersia similis TaxID=206505 RepID=UPI0039EEE8AF
MAANALTPVLVQHYDELVTYVQNRFARHDFAQDVVHEVCLQLLSDPPQETIRTPLAYLRRMSLHRALDWCRAHGTRQAHQLPLDAHTPEGCHHEDGAASLLLKQQLDALIGIINALPPRQRQCFLLNRVHGMEHADIADAIGISRSAVSHHVRAAIQRISDLWEPAHYHSRWLQQKQRSGHMPISQESAPGCTLNLPAQAPDAAEPIGTLQR